MGPALLEDAEPYSSDRGASGALVLHGFTSQPHSVRPLAMAFDRAGFSVELPLLPGHGTTIEDLESYGFADWARTAESALGRLAHRTERVVVAGLSMGGTLALYLAERHPEIAGLVLVNPVVGQSSDENLAALAAELAAGRTVVATGGSDVRRRGASGQGYAAFPIRPLISLLEGAARVEADLGRVVAPVLLCSSRHDRYIPPASGDTIVEHVRSSVERVLLERSGHVATLDHDAAELEQRAVAFARKVVTTP